MSAIAMVHPFCAARPRTGGSLPFNGDLAWVTLALVLFTGAMLQSLAEGTHPVSYIESSYGIQQAADTGE